MQHKRNGKMSLGLGMYRRWKHDGPEYRKTYKSWYSARRRCADINDQNYGGRGISMCRRWLKSFDAFVTDMGVRPEGMTLERINNNGNYEPGNCCWATGKQQAHNRRTNHFVTYAGTTLSITGWAERLGMSK